MFVRDLNVDLFSDAPSAVTFVTIIPNVYKPQMILGISDNIISIPLAPRIEIQLKL